MPTDKVYIGNLPSALVFAALYNNALVRGFPDRTLLDGHMTVEQAQSTLNDRSQATYIEEFRGRVIGVDFTEMEFDPSTYNDANRDGMTAQELVEFIRDTIPLELMAKATTDFRRTQHSVPIRMW